MVPIRTLTGAWQHALHELVVSAKERVTIAAPFITGWAAQTVTSMIGTELRQHGTIDIITDLSPAHVCNGALEPAAVQHLMGATLNARLYHVPRFHAKIYIADCTRAIVTSGNLTASALFRNVEYGFEIFDPQLVAAIDRDLADVRDVGVAIGAHHLADYVNVAHHVLSTFKLQQNSGDPALKEALSQAIQAADDELIRLQFAGGGMHSVFAKTILYILRKHGPLQTQAIHEHIRILHPDLCDDSIDRVIEGQHYGKKWKHAVRTAQQRNKSLGLIKYEEGLWFDANAGSYPDSIR